MTAELHLPDLPEEPIQLGAAPSAGPGAARPVRLPLALRLREALAAYLPLLLMALLALATWWLVERTPGAAPVKARDSGRLEPDYGMSRFTLQRFTPEGRLRVRIDGHELRHYPADDRIEIDRVQLRAIDEDGRVTEARALRAVSNGAASELQLQGGAEVTGTDADGAPIVIRSEFLHALLETDVVRTDRRVEVRHGRNVVVAAGLVYDHRQRRLDLIGPMRAVLQVPR